MIKISEGMGENAEKSPIIGKVLSRAEVDQDIMRLKKQKYSEYYRFEKLLGQGAFC